MPQAHTQQGLTAENPLQTP